ncbi:hypothetical protein TTHERM_00312450 (macronuclear) [Tetrahymena thermophila SB210]|uniref:Uncharacterized protein n=1 Tax=Tetrahymena thermophila (strain SB210) TaxID=312017 RepID=Q22KN6_TETTS|nr:hypothetical protein TTHERM_00312450 [Tetrahymena thermophila SB210]EAR85763.2 hypothetical protein TTHERM_00312450 [Tetrahymena thermophila SB210]|eukprot:XP_001033426.2 hypothetical protein TTHERM_00312450 [Tetrahymena thermophila SB210]
MQEDDTKSQQSQLRKLIIKTNNILENTNLKQIKNQQLLNKNYLNITKDSRIKNLDHVYFNKPIVENQQFCIEQNQIEQCSQYSKYQKQQDLNLICLQKFSNVGDEVIEQALIEKKQNIFSDEQILKNINADKKRTYNLENLSQDGQQIYFKHEMVTQECNQSNNLIESLKKSFIQRQLSERTKQNCYLQEKNNIQNYIKGQETFKLAPKTLEQINQYNGKIQILNKQSLRIIDPGIDVQQNFFKQYAKKSTPLKNVKTNCQTSCDSFTLKGNYYFKIQQKNGLEAMQQMIENKQKTLRIVCGECKKDNDQIFKKDKLFQPKKINQISISSNSQQFQRQMQNPQLKQIQNPIHLKRNYSENFQNSLKLNLVKSQSGKNLLQNQTDKSKLQDLSLVHRQIAKPSEGVSYEFQSRSALDENCKMNIKEEQLDSNLDHNKQFNNKQRLIEKIKQINSKPSHQDIINSRKIQIKNFKSNNLYFQDKNYFSSISSQLKNKEIHKVNHSNLDKTKTDMKNSHQIDEIYGPWDINQFDIDSNFFPSQVSITDLNEFKNQF